MNASDHSSVGGGFLPERLVSPSRGRRIGSSRNRKEGASPSPRRLPQGLTSLSPMSARGTKRSTSNSSSNKGNKKNNKEGRLMMAMGSQSARVGGSASTRKGDGLVSPSSAASRKVGRKSMPIISVSTKLATNSKSSSNKRDTTTTGSRMSQSARVGSTTRREEGSGLRKAKSTTISSSDKPKRKRKSGVIPNQSGIAATTTASSSSELGLGRNVLLDELRMDKSTRGQRSSWAYGHGSEPASMLDDSAGNNFTTTRTRSSKNSLFDELRADKSTRTRSSVAMESPIRTSGLDRLSKSEGHIHYRYNDDADDALDQSIRSRSNMRSTMNTSIRSGTPTRRVSRKGKEKVTKRSSIKSNSTLKSKMVANSKCRDESPPPLMHPGIAAQLKGIPTRHSSPTPVKQYNELNKEESSQRTNYYSTSSDDGSERPGGASGGKNKLFVLPRQLSLDKNSQSNTSTTEYDTDSTQEEDDQSSKQAPPPSQVTLTLSKGKPTTKDNNKKTGTTGKTVTFDDQIEEYEGEDVTREWYTKDFLARLIDHEVQIVSRCNQQLGKESYKSLHCCWRGLEHIQRRIDKGKHIRDHVLSVKLKQVALRSKQQRINSSELNVAEALRTHSRANTKEDRKRALLLGQEDAKYVLRQAEFEKKCDAHDDEVRQQRSAAGARASTRMSVVNPVATQYVSETIKEATTNASLRVSTVVSDAVGGATAATTSVSKRLSTAVAEAAADTSKRVSDAVVGATSGTTKLVSDVVVGATSKLVAATAVVTPIREATANLRSGESKLRGS